MDGDVWRDTALEIGQERVDGSVEDPQPPFDELLHAVSGKRLLVDGFEWRSAVAMRLPFALERQTTVSRYRKHPLCHKP